MIIHIPCSTYRVQFRPEFRLSDAAALVDYLNQLGITDLYASPVFQARPGSSHGYDVVNHAAINQEIGGEDQLRQLSSMLKSRDMGLILDLVPNHMGVHETNPWWWDVLENGPGSPYAPYFDIDWNPPKEELHNRLQIATLGDQFGICLEAGELRLVFEEDTLFEVHYYDKRFPVGPRTWTALLLRVLEHLKKIFPGVHEDFIEFESIITSLHHLPLREEVEPEKIEERQREKEVAKRRLRAVVQKNADIYKGIKDFVTEINGQPGDSSSFNALEQLLLGQAYRLSFWRVAADEINYRRFFDINELAAIRVELPQVFKSVHQTVFRLIQEGVVNGLRIDHPDGLFNPPQYFLDLQKACNLAQFSSQLDTSEFPAEQSSRAMWVVVEKILTRNERLREDWAVHGTTGYDYLNQVNGLLVDSEGERPILKAYAKFTGSSVNFSALMHTCKKLILEVSMPGELQVLARRLDRISEQDRKTRDFTLSSILDALAEYIACFPVYRSYIRPESDQVDDDDRRYILSAIRTAKRRNPSIDPSIYDFIGTIVLLENLDLLTEEKARQRRDFVLRLQQMTGPIMAKGLEDTAFYRDFPLSSLNEVGGEPERFGLSVEEYHRLCMEQFEKWPHTLLGTSTHDTKRSEDVRARLNVISEIPMVWEKALFKWRTLNRRRKKQVDGIHVPTASQEYLFYQTVIGAMPLDTSQADDFAERIKAYMIKAAREAKVHTSWVNVNSAHEDALISFVDLVLDKNHNSRFNQQLEEFVASIAAAGAVNSLSQLLLKATSPGVPDFYQGMELWDFSLVDPDNRRPVDFGLRQRALRQIMQPDIPSHKLLDTWRDGKIKMLITHRALVLRRENSQLFQTGNYLPLTVTGQGADHICAFARHLKDSWAVIVVPRLVVKLGLPPDVLANYDVWTDTQIILPEGAPQQWTSQLTVSKTETFYSHDNRLAVRDLLGRFPVSLLIPF